MQPEFQAVGGSPSVQRRVVLVEDSEDVRSTFKDLLEALGHEVTAVADGFEGIKKVLEVLPDVAFIDVGLPGLDGFEVARRIRAGPGGTKPYLVALTAYGGQGAKVRAEGAGFDAHVTKPIDVSVLHELISRTPPKSR